MKLQLSKDWTIEAEDKYCFTVKHRTVIKDSDSLKDKSRIGEDYWITESYHSNLPMAVESALSKGASFCPDTKTVFDLYMEILDTVKTIKVVTTKPHKRIA